MRGQCWGEAPKLAAAAHNCDLHQDEYLVIVNCLYS
jgi:hypothetical protein